MGLLYFWLPKPVWTYVLGHEFTHAIATMLCGGRVKGMKVGSDGGHVYVTRDNFFVTLAPYFIPIYAIMVFVVFVCFSGVSTPARAGKISTTGQIVEKPYNYNGFR